MIYPSAFMINPIYQIHKSHNTPVPYPQCTIQNRNVHISVLNGALWDMGQVCCGIWEIDLSFTQFLYDLTNCFII